MSWNPEWNILALDIASTTGWCEGPIYGPLKYGSWKLANPGSCQEAFFAGMIEHLGARLMAFKPKKLVFEAPLDPRFMQKINKETIRKLNGLPAVAGGVAYKLGVWDIEEVETGDLKFYWHGKRNIPRAQVKPMTMSKMRALGYDPKNEDEADAISVHRFVSAIIDPALQVEASPLFRGEAR